MSCPTDTDPAPALTTPCRTLAELKLWLATHLKLSIPARAICPQHDAPIEYLRRAYVEPAGDLVVWAPRGGGKTRLAAAATLLDLLHKPGCAVRILGGSLEQSLRTWEHLAPDLFDIARDLLRGRASARRIALSNGSTAAVLTQSQRAVRGLHIQKLRCDEVEMFDRDVWMAAQLIARSKTVELDDAPAGSDALRISGAVEALSTLHAHGGLMTQIIDTAEAEGRPVIRWCIMEVLERCPPDRVCDGCPLWDECRGVAKTHCDGYLSIDDAITMKRRVSLDTWETEMLCRRPVQRKLVFPGFDRAIHVKEQCPAPGEDGRVLTLGVDFGFADPFVCLWVWRYPCGTMWVIDEYVQPQRMLHEHLRQIEQRNWGPVAWIGADPAGRATNDQTAISNVARLSERYRVLTRQSQIIPGVGEIRAAITPAHGQPRLYVHPRCRQLITALRSYRFPDTGGETPLKDGTHDHLIDALRYNIMNALGQSGIKSGRY